MSFDQHLYLIKAKTDGKDQFAEDWTASFRRFLELLLGRLSGEPVSINEISADQLSTEEVYSPFTLLIPVVSPALLNSANFKEEIKLFHEKAINKGSNNIPWSSRIFKVLREPQREHFLLDYLSNSINYDFFHYDSSTDDLVIYDDFTGPSSEKTFWMRLYDMAYDIFRVLDNLKNAESELAHIARDLNQLTVYLSEVGADLLAERDSVKRELQRNGYRVLPERNMPKDLDSIMKLIKKNLAESNMSLHLVGSDYGKIQDTNSSIVDLQNRMAIEHFIELEKLDADTRMNFGRVIWVSTEMKNVSVKQRLFIENLKKDSDSMRDADLLETTIEELKGFVLNKIEDCKAQYNKIYGNAADERKVIYIIHEKADATKCKKIEDYLQKNGFDVISSDFDGNSDDLRSRHSDNLRRCDATLIYYGHDNEGWIKSKQKELLKSLGSGRKKPISPQAILIENEAQLKQSFDMNGTSIILQNQKRFSPKVIEPFIAKLKD
jgi:hypothetical protein